MTFKIGETVEGDYHCLRCERDVAWLQCVSKKATGYDWLCKNCKIDIQVTAVLRQQYPDLKLPKVRRDH